MPDALAWLFSLEQFGIKFGLETISALVEALGHPERTFRSVHVAGTNGKGSVAALADAALRAAGWRSGRYTSPHLLHLSERFVIDGRAVEPGALTAVVEQVRDAVDRLRGQGRIDVHPTFFEVTTAVAFELFRRAKVEVAVCEVGMGGRLDATNVLHPLVGAVTSIALDHQEYLGRTLQEIAIEKAGIIKPGMPVVVGRLAPEALRPIEMVAVERGAEVVHAWSGTDVALAGDAGARESSQREGAPTRMRLRTPAHDYGEVELALLGAHQIGNAVVAVRLLETLDRRGVRVPPAAVAEGLARVAWPGRLDRRRLSDGREVLLDAAHNPEGASALAAFLASDPDKRPLVFAAMRDKDASAMMRVLAPAVGALVLTRASHSRSADPADLAAQARMSAPGLPLSIEPTVGGALAAAWRLSPRIVVGGSIFLVGDVMKELGAP